MLSRVPRPPSSTQVEAACNDVRITVNHPGGALKLHEPDVLSFQSGRDGVEDTIVRYERLVCAAVLRMLHTIIWSVCVYVLVRLITAQLD